MIQQAINEADYLNISIKNVDKVIKKDSDAENILNQNIEVYGKYDGTKLSITRLDSKWDDSDWTKMFVVSYKGNILYPEEYLYTHPDEIGNSIGVSQYKKVFQHIDNNWKSWKSIPTMTEFFFEFLMNKPTLTRQYTKIHELILIGWSDISSYTENNGKFKTTPSGFYMDKRDYYAKTFKVNLPELLFKGILNSLPIGLNDRASEYFPEYEEDYKRLSGIEKWELAKTFFMNIPSLYGSIKEEGVVIHLSSDIGKTQVLKIVQADQYDKQLRFKQKLKYMMEPNDENEYWAAIRSVAEDMLTHISASDKLNTSLKKISKEIYKNWEVSIIHKKKSEQNIKDDLMLTTKSMLIRLLPGNNGALLIGKFRVLTNGHAKMFKKAIKDFDTLSVAVVSNKETKSTLDLRIEMIKTAFPGVEIITTTSGNLLTIINKSKNNINAVIAGSDRIKNYKDQLIRNKDVKVYEIKRTDDDESATKVIRNIKNIKYFKDNTPKKIHKYYDELVKTYTQGESFTTRRYLKEAVNKIQG